MSAKSAVCDKPQRVAGFVKTSEIDDGFPQQGILRRGGKDVRPHGAQVRQDVDLGSAHAIGDEGASLAVLALLGIGPVHADVRLRHAVGFFQVQLSVRGRLPRLQRPLRQLDVGLLAARFGPRAGFDPVAQVDAVG